MAGARGLEREILASLLVVMATATAMLVAVMLRTQEEHLRQLRQLAARALVAEARAAPPLSDPSLPELRWWRVAPGGDARPRGDHADTLDAAGRAIAAEARERGAPLLRAATPWEPIRFALPLPNGEVAVARLPSASPLALVIGLLLADVAVFTGFGVVLLRRRLVLPLRRLAGAARAIADGDEQARAPVDGVGEIAEVAGAFNEMTDALAQRSGALHKAVAELRESNRHLREARVGLDRAERLAAVGNLAAGVAHEVGNPMGALLAFLDLVRRDAGLSASGRGHLDRAAQEGERVRRILRQLLDFSRPRRSCRSEVDLGAICRETAELVGAQRRYAGVAIEVESEGSPPPVLSDRALASQIVLNLLLNAADALTSASVVDPRIRVCVRPAAARARAGEDAAAAAGRREFDGVECRVGDNGPGIPAADRERIFDPFFTTKDPGEGTGLGLANAARFAEELGGSLVLRPPDAGGGAVFSLWLPTRPLPSASAARPPAG